jgi:hypothetical protein
MEAKVRAYEQKLHTRRGKLDDAAKEAKIPYCTEATNVDAEAT